MSVPDDLCPRCGAQKDEGDTMCIDCIFANAPDTQAEMTRLTAALAQSRAETQAALAGCVKIKPLVWELRADTSGPYYSTLEPLYNQVIRAPDEKTCDDIDSARVSRIRAAIQPDTSKLALVREAFRNIEELNLLPPDENGHRWEASDLIGQEIRDALSRIAALE